jgi:hypothetical protein
MSVARIRTLLNDRLIAELKVMGGGTKLKYPTFVNGHQNKQGEFTGNHLFAELVPSPVINDTLSGDHKGYVGLYQIAIQSYYGLDETVPNPDLQTFIDEVVADLELIFPINARIGDENEFVVQVLSSISVSQLTNLQKGSPGIGVYAHFLYRADTN